MNGQILGFLGSFAAVSALVVIVHLAGFSRPARLASEREAYELARLAPGGFEPARIALDADGRGAIAADASGRLMLLRPHGAQFVGVPVSRDALRGEGEILLVGTPAGPFPLRLGPDAALWAKG